VRPHFDKNKLGKVIHACDLSYMGVHRKEDHGMWLAPGKNARPYLKNNLKQKGLECGSSGRVPA
jgi:hypothetical protein